MRLVLTSFLMTPWAVGWVGDEGAGTSSTGEPVL
jgi:hypothetical protein